MDYREMILSTICGKVGGCIPYVPRLDLWYKANKLGSTLPVKYKNASLMEITDDLEIGYHGVIPDYREYENDDGDVDLGLGIYRFKTIPYSVNLKNIERRVTRENGLTATEYYTPYGKIYTKVLYDENMKKSGMTVAHTVEYAIKSIHEFKSIAYIFENAEVKPNYDYFLEFKNKIGNRGVAVAFNSFAASPMHYIMKELMCIETFFYESFDHQDELQQLAQSIAKFYNSVFEITAASPADIVLSGANYDTSITPPPYFEKYILPSLKGQSEFLHNKGKYLLTHTDGENKGLLKLYKKSRFDIADSICPSPMTGMTLREIKEEFAGDITIWGGIPAICMLEESMDNYEFDKFLDMTMESIGRGDHIIFSIADTAPPGTIFKRIKRIAEKVKEFGPIK